MSKSTILTPYLEVFQRFVPEKAVAYCAELYTHHGFEFKIKRSRQTKYGDYRYDRRNGKHTITINNDLNPYAFLITYIHEVAHLVTYKKYQRTVNPHGVEWKQNFIHLMKPLLNSSIFPNQLLHVLKNYFKDPKASSCSDPELFKVLRQYDPVSDTIYLREIAIGEVFTFNQKSYQKLEKKRTRSVCMELQTKRKYLISEIAPVTK